LKPAVDPLRTIGGHAAWIGGQLGAEVGQHGAALLGAAPDLLAEPGLEAHAALMQQHAEPVDAAMAARAGGGQQRVSSGT
jgi:hypothetical protein